MHITRTLTAAVAAVALVATVGCEPDTRPAQQAGTTVITSDSIGWQYALAGGGADTHATSWHTGPGWQMDACVNGITPVCATPLNHVRGQVDAATAETVVYALGTNDSHLMYGGGWDTRDERVWTAGLTAPPAESCVAVVLPWVAPHVQGHYDIDAARGWITDAAALLPNVHVVDWAPYAQQPGVLDGDGVHLAYGPGGSADVAPTAYEARRAVFAEAVASCP